MKKNSSKFISEKSSPIRVQEQVSSVAASVVVSPFGKKRMSE